MPLIYWRQVKDEIEEPKVLTGSLGLSGSFSIGGTLMLNSEEVKTVLAGSGFTSSSVGSQLTLSLDTGSLHFLNAVAQSGIFRITGSAYSTTNEVQVTGSLEVSGSIIGNGIVELKPQVISPIAIPGGIYYSADDMFYFGFVE